MNDLGEMAKLVRTHSAEASAFSPCAFYDERLDCIRVIARDCSVVEDRISDRITVLVDAHYPRDRAEDLKYVGFTIKGARHFCKEYGLATGTIKLTSLLDAILKACPEAAVQVFVEHIARPLVEKSRIEQVEVREDALATT